MDNTIPALEPSTWPVWVVTAIICVLVIFIVTTLIYRHELNVTERLLKQNEDAWKHLAKMAPLLKERDVFGKIYSDSGIYAYEIKNPREIDIERVITAGEQYDERKRYSKTYKDLQDLDRILAPLRPEEKE